MAAGSPVELTDRFSITLEAIRSIAWQGSPVRIADESLQTMDRCAASFAEMVAARVREDPAALIYGVTTAPGDRAGAALDAEGQARRPTRLWTAMSYGDPLPQRVTRAIVVARLANFLGGHAAAGSHVALALTEMLNEGPIPDVPVQGNGGSGEILSLGALFYDLSARISLSAKERMALINGSPCAAALLADMALSGRRRRVLAEQTAALIAAVTGAPHEHYAPELEELWGDEHEAAALRALRTLLDGDLRGQQRKQAAVSLRILPRVLGSLRRAQAAIEAAARVSLSSVTDNPVYIVPTADRPLGAVYSTGGYHNAQAAPAIDGLAVVHADLCQLAERLTDHLFQHPDVGPLLGRDEWTIKPVHMAVNGWAEQARATAQPTLLSLGAFGQNDVVALNFLAWQKATAVARCLDESLAGLLAIASQALYMQDREAPHPLRPLLDHVRQHVAPVTSGDTPRPLGRDIEQLAQAFTAEATGGGRPVAADHRS